MRPQRCRRASTSGSRHVGRRREAVERCRWGASPYLTLTRSNNTAGSTYSSAFGLCANGTYGLQLMSGFNGGPYTNNVTIGASLSNNVPYVLVAVFAVSNWSVYAFPQTG